MATYEKKFQNARRGPSPKTVSAPPKWLNLERYDKLPVLSLQGWAQRLARREAKLDERRFHEEWGDIVSTNPELRRSTNPQEIDDFLERTSSTVECWDLKRPKPELAEKMAHAVRVGFAAFAFDPHLSDDVVRTKFNDLLLQVRKDCPIQLRRAKPGKPSGSPSISGTHLLRWHEHRILLLFDLILRGENPAENRKTLAAWMFPEVAGDEKRGKKFDEARHLLDEARNVNRTTQAEARLQGE